MPIDDHYLARLISAALLAEPLPLSQDVIERVVLDAIALRACDRVVLGVLRERAHQRLGPKKRQSAESLVSGVGCRVSEVSASLARLVGAGLVEQDADGVVRPAGEG